MARRSRSRRVYRSGADAQPGEKHSRTVVGQTYLRRGKGYLRSLDLRPSLDVRILDLPRSFPPGSIVSVRLLTEPGSDLPPMGELIEVLGQIDDPDIQYKIACHSRDIPMRFSDQVVRAAGEIEPGGDGDWEGRVDHRGSSVVTIDGESARDFDDAVHVERQPGGGFTLNVHIADVSHYVQSGDLLDREAFLRGTSVYFPDRALPMLPERLSNDLCSLRPNQDRPAMTVRIEYDGQGAPGDVQVAKSVIRSRARLTYSEVEKILIERHGKRSTLAPALEAMRDLSRLLRRKRLARGAIDLDLPEAEVVVTGTGRPIEVRRAVRHESHRIIEEFMLAANEAVCRFLQARDVPQIYRIHEEPDPEKVERFREVAGTFGYWLNLQSGKRLHPRPFQALLEKMQGKAEHRFLSFLMLRSFKVARYSSTNQGHFGLASPHYLHFTSPIRRYPDLVVHRILSMVLEGRQKTAPARHLYRQLADIAEQASERERAAAGAERSIVQWLKAEFMRQKLGEEFEGWITNVRPAGLHVELRKHFVEGFVPVESFKDESFRFRSSTRTLVGARSGTVFRMGRSVRVRVDRADPERRHVDFSVLSGS